MACVHGPAELKEIWGLPAIDGIFAAIPRDKKFELEIKGCGEDFAGKVDAARERAALKRENIIVAGFDSSAVED